MNEISPRATILTRLSVAIREQNWFAVVLEFLIVTAGVLMGFQLANWNEDRQERAEVERLIDRLLPDFTGKRDGGPAFADYYASRIALGQKAERLWSERGEDAEFVKAAVLTGSYAVTITGDQEVYALEIGAEMIPRIGDDELRIAIVRALDLQADEYLRFSYTDSDFRKTVRRIVPSGLVELLLEECNDYNSSDGLKGLEAISTIECTAQLPPEMAAKIAAELRSDPTALGELREHINRLRNAQARMKRLQEVFGEAVAEIEESRAQ